MARGGSLPPAPSPHKLRAERGRTARGAGTEGTATARKTGATTARKTETASRFARAPPPGPLPPQTARGEGENDGSGARCRVQRPGRVAARPRRARIPRPPPPQNPGGCGTARVRRALPRRTSGAGRPRSFGPARDGVERRGDGQALRKTTGGVEREGVLPLSRTCAERQAAPRRAYGRGGRGVRARAGPEDRTPLPSAVPCPL